MFFAQKHLTERRPAGIAVYAAVSFTSASGLSRNGVICNDSPAFLRIFPKDWVMEFRMYKGRHSARS